MTIHVTSTHDGRVLEIEARGQLTHEDYQRFLPEIDALMKKGRKMRLLFNMRDFHGWQLTAAWDDFKFGVHHLTDIDRMAMVGDTKWEQAMAVVFRPFTSAQVRYFDHTALEEARRWLAEP